MRWWNIVHLKESRVGNLRRGQPNSRSKLTAELSAKICGYVADGMSWQDTAAMADVRRNVISIWKAKGDADPQSEYGVFLKSAEDAAYTPLSIGPDGKIYTQNDGHIFVVGD